MNGQGPRIYLLDTNVFIEAHRRYYSLSICPGFWECLEHYCQEPRVLSIDRVRKEISEGDALDSWVQGAPDELFVSSSEEPVIKTFTQLMNWVNASAQYRQEAKEEFARVPDGWIIAYAKVHGMTVVTQETPAPYVKRKVPIPNVCDEFDVKWKDTFEMLQELEVRFNWNH